MVPSMAYKVMAPIFSKNPFRSNEYPASNIIGGNRKKKNTSGDCNKIEQVNRVRRVNKKIMIMMKRAQHETYKFE